LKGTYGTQTNKSRESQVFRGASNDKTDTVDRSSKEKSEVSKARKTYPSKARRMITTLTPGDPVIWYRTDKSSRKPVEKAIPGVFFYRKPGGKQFVIKVKDIAGDIVERTVPIEQVRVE
jgi:hypothetical protein